MTPDLPALTLSEIGPFIQDAQKLNDLGNALLLEHLTTKKQQKLKALLRLTQQELRTADAEGVPQMPAAEYHHLMGNLSAVYCNAIGEEDKETADRLVTGAMDAMAASGEGTWARRWRALRSILTNGRGGTQREQSSVATASRRATDISLLTKRLDLLLDIVSSAYPGGVDLLKPSRNDQAVTALDASEQVTVTMRDNSGPAETILFTPHPKKTKTTITFTQWLHGSNNPMQDLLNEDDALLIGSAHELKRLFGAKLSETVVFPTHLDLGNLPSVPHLIVVRTKGKLGFLLQNTRNVLHVHQGEHHWRYDPLAATNDTYGDTEYVNLPNT